MAIRALIMAAGHGTRMKSEMSKLLHKVNGVPMLLRVKKALSGLNAEKEIFILGYQKDKIIEEIKDIDYVHQAEQLGTGHAVSMASEIFSDYDGDVIIINGDMPLITTETLKSFYDKYKACEADGAIMSAYYDKPQGYGRLIKEGEKVLGIVEEKDANEEQKNIKHINAGVYIFDSKLLFAALKKINNNNNNGEYYLPDVIKILNSEGKKIIDYCLEDNSDIFGVNSKYDLAQAEKIARNRKNKELMLSGVTLIDPDNSYIEDDVVIGQDSIIYPNVTIQGATKIGKNTNILANTRIINSTIADNVVIESSLIESSIVEEGVSIGPFAHLRPKSHLKTKVHVGNFVEIKNSTLEAGVKAGHLIYLGDASVGTKTNIGAGTITCNYDGKNKFKTEIGDNVFIGSDTILIAPVNVGDESFVAAGSVITKDVPTKTLAVARSRQNIKEKWRKK